MVVGRWGNLGLNLARSIRHAFLIRTHHFLHHICWEVADMNKRLARFTQLAAFVPERRDLIRLNDITGLQVQIVGGGIREVVRNSESAWATT
jgi:hypothetical protein